MKSFVSSTPAWAEISLKALKNNFRELQKKARESEILPVVKANAYGHGLVPVSKTLLQTGARFLAVAYVQEGVDLRKAGVRCPILVLTPTLPPEIPILLRNKLTPQVSSYKGALALAQTAKKLGFPRVTAHVKLDTGMHRLGFQVGEAVREIIRMEKIPGFHMEALYTHMATADWSNPQYAWNQIALFKRTLGSLKRMPVFQTLASHVANSAALLAYYPQAEGTWARPGLALYGVYPNSRLKNRAKLTPVMQLRARILHIKTLEKGESVSYGLTYTAKKRIKVATLGIGYADGLHRSLSNKGVFLVHGKRVPLIGRVCMDMTMADVSKVPNVQIGDVATVFGRDGKDFLPVEEQAARAG